ncbi:unnamed protein product, partial [Staurois parvus]
VHCWAQVGRASGRHCWQQVGGTGGWRCWAPIIRALIISALMVGADPCSDNCRFSAVLSSCSDSVRKVQPRTVSSSATHQCRPPVPSSAAHKCLAVPPFSAQQCHPPV